jgi:hypothetical protein
MTEPGTAPKSPVMDAVVALEAIRGNAYLLGIGEIGGNEGCSVIQADADAVEKILELLWETLQDALDVIDLEWRKKGNVFRDKLGLPARQERMSDAEIRRYIEEQASPKTAQSPSERALLLHALATMRLVEKYNQRE